MKSTYDSPRLDIIKFDTVDIITTSSNSTDVDGGSVSFPDGWEQQTTTLSDW